MRRTTQLLITIGLSLPLAFACEQSKSANPLSPAIAGPIEGVTISAPQPVQPASGAQVAVDQQPVTLTVVNAETSGVRPLSYVFQVAADATFNAPLFTQNGVAQSSTGQTSLVMPQPFAADHAYYWRARAQDGANTGEFSGGVSFSVYTPVVIQAPVLASPADNATVSSLRPTLTVNDAARTGPAGPITYKFEAASDPSFAAKFASIGVGETAGQTSYTLTTDLPATTRVYWRVLAFDSGHVSPYSAIRNFVTPAVVIVPPNQPPTGPAAGDQLDLNTVSIAVGPAAIASWRATSTVTSTSMIPHNFCITHTMLGRWPTAPFFGDPNTPVEGNQWVFALIGGRWYGGAADWYRPGQACKDVDATTIGADAFGSEPLHSWVPKVGETMAVMSSTPARAWPDMSTVDERTNVVIVKWGQ